MHVSVDIGSRLGEERRRRGLTQDQVAEALGVSKRTQANYEAGSSDAPAAYLYRAVENLGFDVNYIILGARSSKSKESLNSDEDALIEHYRTISDDDRAAVKRIVRAMAIDAAREP
ncbi:DNA-binding protein [Pseudomonas marginalis ICMP 11289]|nr:DNA-binding protein [Pseudomonas marginalis ICMP 11289]